MSNLFTGTMLGGALDGDQYVLGDSPNLATISTPPKATFMLLDQLEAFARWRCRRRQIGCY